MKKTVTWVVVADAAEARILANDGPGKGLRPVPISEMSDAKLANREIMADRPGRTFDRHGQGRHAMEPKTPAKAVRQDAFLAGVATRLEQGAAKGEYDRLVLVAPPKALGRLRKHLGKAAHDKVQGEIHKDLTHVSAAGLVAQLGDVLPA